uniref:Putative LOC101236261 [Hydra vulgaris] n=1 Tax=Lepeophtheirus salmonis TaxID=72036 RepID=A0A0K2UCA4_LEPSM
MKNIYELVTMFHDVHPFVPSLSQFAECVVAYIGVFVIKSVFKHLVCLECLESLYSYLTDIRNYSLIARKSNDGLLFPAKDVI